jgi:hypothetical protein
MRLPGPRDPPNSTWVMPSPVKAGPTLPRRSTGLNWLNG